MADSGDRDRAGRRRRRRGGRKERDDSDPRNAVPSPAKPPVILAKPSSDRSHSSETQTKAPSDVKPVVMLKTRDDSRPVQPSNLNTSTQSIPGMLATEHAPTQPMYQIQKNPSILTAAGQEDLLQNRLSQATEMKSSVKLVDETFHWSEAGLEYLVDQSDFLVVGVLGLQGSGKSTVMSVLAGNSLKADKRSFVFKPQSKEILEVCGHQTSGIDMYITKERMILLDCQPIMSASVLDHMIHHDKKFSSEFSTAENCVEMQSLQLMTFMMTVCNVVLVVQDWFADVNLLRMLQTAEMLKPSRPIPPQESAHEDLPEYFPDIVMVLNKAKKEDFNVESYESMEDVINRMFAVSKLKYKGCVSLANTSLFPGIQQRCDKGVNIFLLPDMKNTSQKDAILTLLPEYTGHPSFEILQKTLTNQLLSIPRCLLTHTTLSEKNWFHYAARTWDTVKKSQLLLEYNRLLP